MDGVLFDIVGYNESGEKVAISSWNVIFDRLGIYSEHERLKGMYIKGTFPSYMEWTDEACRVLKKNGLTENQFLEVINSKPFMNGAEETFEELNRRNYRTATITGSFEALGLRARRILGLDYAIGHCKLIFDENGNISNWILIPCDFDGKIVYFNKLLKDLTIKPEESVYVGDDINDIPIFREVGLSIAFNSTKDEVKDSADFVVEKKDLREVLKHL